MSAPDDRRPDLPIGVVFPGRGRTISDGEIELLAWVSLLGEQPRELDAADGPTGGRRLDPHLLMPVAVCLAALNPLYARLESDGFHVVAALSHVVSNIHEVHGGDTLTVDTELTGARDSRSRPAHLVVEIRDIAHNQDGVTVATIERRVLYRYGGGRQSEPGGN